jgi:eukaryotic-like serine/threonine-protein kinase
VLPPGHKFGPYEIVSAIGAGGMGEVYRARDTRLDRTVAIKVLPQHLSERAEAKERFDREARAVSSLSHPNICHLYDVGTQDGISYLVMEYLEGETLADRLAKGPLPLEQVVMYGAEIAAGLEQAHRSNVIHRDLKPGNIMLTKSGAKLMDFGLAKPALANAQPASASLAQTLAQSSQPLTAEGTVVGTFQYMSPEQVEGKEADARSDIFALGAVLYEMVTGRRAFEGKTTASTIAAILAMQPEPISAVQPMTPPALDYVVRTCLAKDPEERFQTAHDVKLQLRWLAQPSQASATIVTRARKNTWNWALPVGAVLVLVAGFVAAKWLKREPQPPPMVVGSIAPPAGMQFNLIGDFAGPPVVSADGSSVAFCASSTAGARSLWIRNLATGANQQLNGTAGATFPFWSPDGRALGFFTDGKLKTIQIASSEVNVLADAPVGRGGAWGSADYIVFSPDTRAGIFKVPASGGTPQQITKVDTSRHTSHRWPFFLPDGHHFVFLATSHESPRSDKNGIFVGSIDGGDPRMLVRTLGNASFAAGSLLFARENNLIAQKLEGDGSKLSGEARVIAQHVVLDLSTWYAAFSSSQNGVLVYHAGASQAGSLLTWYDRTGKAGGAVGERNYHDSFQLSPEGNRVAVAEGNPSRNIFVYDLARGSRMRLTFGAGEGELNPVWSPDGQWIAFSKRLNGRATYSIFRKRSDGSGEEEEISSSNRDRIPLSWSSDGHYLLYSEGTLGAGDAGAISMRGDKEDFMVVLKDSDTYNAQFSPDGRWVAYVNIQSGQQELYATSFPKHESTWQLSNAGCTEPRWSRNGREIFCVTFDNNLESIEVNGRGSSLQIGPIRRLFQAPLHTSNFNMWSYDVSADGNNFLFSADASAGDVSQLTVLANWTQRK